MTKNDKKLSTIDYDGGCGDYDSDYHLIDFSDFIDYCSDYKTGDYGSDYIKR